MWDLSHLNALSVALYLGTLPDFVLKKLWSLLMCMDQFY